MCVYVCVCVPESLELHARMVGSSVLSIGYGAVSQVFASTCLLSSSVSGSISAGGSGHSLVNKTALDRPAAPLIISNKRDSLAPHNLISKGKDVLNPRLYASIRFCSLLAIACLDFFLISRKNSFLTCTQQSKQVRDRSAERARASNCQTKNKNKQGLLPLELFFCFVFVWLLFCFSA